MVFLRQACRPRSSTVREFLRKEWVCPGRQVDSIWSPPNLSTNSPDQARSRENASLQSRHPGRFGTAPLMIEPQEMKEPMRDQDIELPFGGVPELARLPLENRSADHQLAQETLRPEWFRCREAQDIGRVVLPSIGRIQPLHRGRADDLDGGRPRTGGTELLELAHLLRGGDDAREPELRSPGPGGHRLRRASHLRGLSSRREP